MSTGDGDFLVTLEDYRAVRKGRSGEYCLPGLKRWAERNGKSYRKILREGLLLSELREIKDPYLAKVIECAEIRRARETEVK